jgi:hypothetical protein
MKLFKVNQRNDFGKEVYFGLLEINRYCLLQISFDYSDSGGYPYLQITSGMGKLFGILASIGRYGMCFEILARDWSWCYDKKTLDEEFENDA